MCKQSTHILPSFLESYNPLSYCCPFSMTKPTVPCLAYVLCSCLNLLGPGLDIVSKSSQSVSVLEIEGLSDQETTSQSLQVARPAACKNGSCKAIFSYLVTKKAGNAYLHREKNEEDIQRLQIKKETTLKKSGSFL